LVRAKHAQPAPIFNRCVQNWKQYIGLIK